MTPEEEFEAWLAAQWIKTNTPATFELAFKEVAMKAYLAADAAATKRTGRQD